MNRFLVLEFSNQRWGVDVGFVAGVTGLTRECPNFDSLPEQITVGERVIPLTDPADLFGLVSYEPTAVKMTRAVLLSRGSFWLGLAVHKVLTIEPIEMSHAGWVGSYVPVGVRRDLLQGAGTTPDGSPVLLIHAERLISAWQEKQGLIAFPLPKGPRLGEKILSQGGVSLQKSYSGPERRSHLRLERTEQVLIQKSKQSGYPAYRTVISFRKDLKNDSLQVVEAVKILEQFGTVVGKEVIHRPKILGKFGRHLGLIYLTQHPPETVLNRLHEIEEVDQAELISFK